MLSSTPSRVLGPAVAGLGAIALGLATAIDAQPVMLAVLAAGLVVLALYNRHGWTTVLLLGIAAVPVVAGLTVAGINGVGSQTTYSPMLRHVDDAAMAVGWLLLPLAWGSVPERARLYGTLAFGALVGGELIALVADSSDLPLRVGAIWQDLRWLGLVGWGLVIGRALGPHAAVRSAFVVLCVWSAANVLVSVVQIATNQAGRARLGIPQVDGLFGHPTAGALAATSLCVLVLTDIAAGSRDRLLPSRDAFWGLGLALLTIVLSTRFKPVLGIVAVVLLIVVLRGTGSVLLAALAVPVAVVLGSLAFALSGDVAAGPNASAQTNVLSASTGNAPTRISLMRAANRLAQENPPLGHGLGTFGSDLSAAQEQRAFDLAGLGATYGFRYGESNFRADSYVAHVLAERGYAGLALWLAGLAGLVAAFLVAVPRHLFPAAALAAMIAMTPIGPALHSVQYALLMMLPAVVFGAGLLTRTHRAPHDAAPGRFPDRTVPA